MSKRTPPLPEVFALSCVAVGALFGAWLGGSMAGTSDRTLRRLASIAGGLLGGLLLGGVAFVAIELIRRYRRR